MESEHRSSTSAISVSSFATSVSYSSIGSTSSASVISISSSVFLGASSSSVSTLEKFAALDCGPVSGEIVANQLDTAAKAYILCKHNETRSRVALGGFAALYGNLAIATDMKRLQWDSKLEEVAQAWANQCRWQHNGNRASQYNSLNPTDVEGGPLLAPESVGENLAYKGSTNVAVADLQYAVDGYDAWVTEGRDYSLGLLNVSDHCDAEACGHFTQLIWANTYKVGCAINACPANTLASVATTYFVCDYASAGNYVGQNPYEEGSESNDVCSTADTEQGTCRNGLTEASGYASDL